MAGNFIVKCKDSNGVVSYSKEISYDRNDYTIGLKIWEGCRALQDKVEVFSENRFDYYENGREFFLRFSGKNEDMG